MMDSQSTNSSSPTAEGGFGSFHVDKGYGVKRYFIKEDEDKTLGMICHAFTERNFLEDLTELCSQEIDGPLAFLSNRIAKFDSAWIEKKHVCSNKKKTAFKKRRIDEAVACLRMEYVPGGELSDYLMEHENGISIQEALKLSCDIIQTLALLHGMGIAHRDLKLDNLMVKADGTPVFIDWGTSISSTDGKREKSVVCGTKRANSWQVLLLEAIKDHFNVEKKLKEKIRGAAGLGYDIEKNDLVGIAHILSAIWTSCLSEGDHVCGAFGSEWDELAEEEEAGNLCTVMQVLYQTLKKQPHWGLIPQPFRDILQKFVLPEEENRMSALEAWNKLWSTRYFKCPLTGIKIDMRKDLLMQPPSEQFFDNCRTKLQKMRKYKDATPDGEECLADKVKKHYLTLHELVNSWDSKCAVCATLSSDCDCSNMGSATNRSQYDAMSISSNPTRKVLDRLHSCSSNKSSLTQKTWLKVDTKFNDSLSQRSVGSTQEPQSQRSTTTCSTSASATDKNIKAKRNNNNKNTANQPTKAVKVITKPKKKAAVKGKVTPTKMKAKGQTKETKTQVVKKAIVPKKKENKSKKEIKKVTKKTTTCV